MIKRFAGTITSFLVNDNIIDEDEQEIYQYGIEQILINISMLVVIFLIAYITNSWTHTILWLCGMLPIRGISGGYHASSPIKCSFLTVLVFIINIVMINLLKNYMSIYIFLFFLVLILFSVFRFAPVDHKNKELVWEAYLIAKKKSYIAGIVIVGLCLILALIFGIKSIITISNMMGAVTASISLIIGGIMRGGERNENHECCS